ncbi:hypothetical protein C8F04DRAFT_1193990 [Mycena alexandri]|uniref:Uncharacterized protein n=1 Tax=Mycena alexandri TaxID=1745969 RepID=A0AAD6S878_9AGAR|nr:hypothetical protein C8F04DRAFT_1193990 [Mycena alexandri]
MSPSIARARTFVILLTSFRPSSHLPSCISTKDDVDSAGINSLQRISRDVNQVKMDGKVEKRSHTDDYRHSRLLSQLLKLNYQKIEQGQVFGKMPRCRDTRHSSGNELPSGGAQTLSQFMKVLNNDRTTLSFSPLDILPEFGIHRLREINSIQFSERFSAPVDSIFWDHLSLPRYFPIRIPPKISSKQHFKPSNILSEPDQNEPTFAGTYFHNLGGKNNTAEYFFFEDGTGRPVY